MREEEDALEVEDWRGRRCCKGRKRDEKKIFQSQKMREEGDTLEVRYERHKMLWITRPEEDTSGAEDERGKKYFRGRRWERLKMLLR